MVAKAVAVARYSELVPVFLDIRRPDNGTESLEAASLIPKRRETSRYRRKQGVLAARM